MNNVLKCIVLGLVFCSTLAFLPISAQGAENVHQIIALRASVLEEVKSGNSMSWMVCGNYFAAGETTEGEIIHFTFEKQASDKPEIVFAFGPVGRLIVSIDRSVIAPMAIVRNNWVTLIMSPEDYIAGLPCLAKSSPGV